MSGDQLAAVGAFLSGIASVATASIYLRYMRKRYEEECEKRFQALREGMKLARHETDPDPRE